MFGNNNMFNQGFPNQQQPNMMSPNMMGQQNMMGGGFRLLWKPSSGPRQTVRTAQRSWQRWRSRA
jgi:hypothetical protein